MIMKRVFGLAALLPLVGGVPAAYQRLHSAFTWAVPEHFNIAQLLARLVGTGLGLGQFAHGFLPIDDDQQHACLRRETSIPQLDGVHASLGLAQDGMGIQIGHDKCQFLLRVECPDDVLSVHHRRQIG